MNTTTKLTKEEERAIEDELNYRLCKHLFTEEQYRTMQHRIVTNISSAAEAVGRNPDVVYGLNHVIKKDLNTK